MLLCDCGLYTLFPPTVAPLLHQLQFLERGKGHPPFRLCVNQLRLLKKKKAKVEPINDPTAVPALCSKRQSTPRLFRDRHFLRHTHSSIRDGPKDCL